MKSYLGFETPLRVRPLRSDDHDDLVYCTGITSIHLGRVHVLYIT